MVKTERTPITQKRISTNTWLCHEVNRDIWIRVQPWCQCLVWPKVLECFCHYAVFFVLGISPNAVVMQLEASPEQWLHIQITLLVPYKRYLQHTCESWIYPMASSSTDVSWTLYPVCLNCGAGLESSVAFGAPHSGVTLWKIATLYPARDSLNR